MDTSATVELSMLPPLQGEVLVDAWPVRPAPPAAADHDPSSPSIVLAIALLLWALNWRRGKPGLFRTILRQIRR